MRFFSTKKALVAAMLLRTSVDIQPPLHMYVRGPCRDLLQTEKQNFSCDVAQLIDSFRLSNVALIFFFNYRVTLPVVCGHLSVTRGIKQFT